MRKVGISVCLALMLLTVWGYRQVSLAQTDSDYVEETGHRISGEFWAFYSSVEEPLLLYGYPLTEAFPDPKTGRLIQYFEKARFELHPEQPLGRRVQLTPIGFELYAPGSPEAHRTETGACRMFPGLPFRVCYTFLEFFEAHGGEARFGLPISNIELHNGKLVQYFELARFEWRPGLDGRSTVVLTNLGLQYFYHVKEDIRRLAPDDDDLTADVSLLRLRARAYPQAAVTRRSGDQRIYILVQDQRLMAVENADITILIHLPDGETLRIIAPEPTDQNGITTAPFRFDSGRVGMARVEIIARRNQVEVRAETSFRIWY